MKRAEERIDRVLRGLGRAEPPPDLAQRVMGRLSEHGARAAGRPGRAQGMASWMRLSMSPGLAGATVAGVVAMGVFLLALGVRPAREASSPTERPARPEANPAALPPQRVPSAPAIAERLGPGSRVQAGPVRREGGVERASAVPVAEKTARPEKTASPGGAGLETAGLERAGLETADLRAAREPGFPAPPLPLTEQEQLLLRVVHRGDPEQIAMLDPAERAKREMRSRTDFHEFFNPGKATEESKTP